jgi:hypothetical protein
VGHPHVAIQRSSGAAGCCRARLLGYISVCGEYLRCSGVVREGKWGVGVGGEGVGGLCCRERGGRCKVGRRCRGERRN